MWLKTRHEDAAAKLFIVNLGIFLNVFIFINYFKFRYSLPAIIIFSLCISSLLIIIINRKHRNILIFLLGVICFVVGFLLRKYLESGIYYILREVYTNYNIYNGEKYVQTFGSRYYGSKARETLCITLVLCAAIVEYAYIIVTATWFRMYAMIHILLSMFIIAFGWSFGRLPTTPFIILLIFYYLCCIAYQHETVLSLKKIGYLAIGCVISAGIILMIQNPFQYKKKNRLLTVQKKFDYVAEKLKFDDIIKKNFGNSASDGKNDGELGKVGKIEYTNKCLFWAELEKSCSVYLKTNVYTDYQSDKWKKTEVNSLVFINKLKSKKNQIIQNEAFDFFSSIKSVYHVQTISIDADEGVFPYFAQYEKEETDLIPSIEKNSDKNVFSYFNLSFEDIAGYLEVNGLIDKNKDYTNYVYSTDLNIPDYIREYFDKIFPDAPHYDHTIPKMRKCIKYIQEYLYTNTNYSLNPGVCNPKYDFVIDFLENKKEGFCTAYATTTVLAMRYMGIPARYVEGFVINDKNYNDKDAKKTGEIYTVPIRDNAAHAWAEIYLEGIGFVPIDTTPGDETLDGYENELDSDSDLGETEKTTKIEETETSKKEEKTSASEHKTIETDDTYNSNTQETTVETANNSTLYFGIIVFVILGIGVPFGIYFCLKIRNKRKLSLLIENNKHNVTLLQTSLYQMVKKYGIVDRKDIYTEQKAEQLNLLIDKLEKKVIHMQSLSKSKKKIMLPNKTDTLLVLEIFNKVKYSQKDILITDNEYKKVYTYIMKFKNSLQYCKNRL